MRDITKVVILIVIGLMMLLPFASTFPDGLEKVAESLGVGETASLWSGLMPDYNFPFTADSYITKFFSGLSGLFLTLAVAWGVGRAITRKTRFSK